MIHQTLILPQNKKILALVGMTGCGKSVVGHLLSKRLSVPFADLDEEIVKRFGDIKKIFAEQGEYAFRKLEYRTLCSLLDRYSAKNGKTADVGSLADVSPQQDSLPSLILATGGGVPTYRPSFHLLKKRTTVVWLWRNPQEIPPNSPIFSRPPINGSICNYQKLLNSRYLLYQNIADISIVNRYPQKTALLLADMFDQATVSAVPDSTAVSDKKGGSEKTFPNPPQNNGNDPSDHNSGDKKYHQNIYQRRNVYVKENSENPLARTGENHDGNGTRR